MLKDLKIKNVAVVSDAFIEFCNGLNIISGETGAGKSVILDALSLILGAKADKGLIKSGEDFLKVDATFVLNEESSKLKSYFEEIDIEFEDCIKISRKITLDGKNEAKINNVTVPVSYLKMLAGYILDIHTQNENLVLLNKSKQLELIDNYAKIDKTNVKKIYQDLLTINEKIEDLDKDEDLRERELDLLNFQINEIENAKFIKGEEEELENQLVLLKNCEKINNSLNVLKEIFDYGNVNILSSLKRAENELSNLNNFNNCEELLNRLKCADIEINDIYSEITNKFSYDFNEERFNEIDDRLDLYKKLHRKYGVSFDDIMTFLNKSIEKKEYLLNFEENLNKLKKQKEDILTLAYEESLALSKKRKEASLDLQKKVVNELHDLSMPNAKVDFSVSDFSLDNFENKFTQSGANTVEILFSANLGEDVKPLSMVASGGEISRLMLAIKAVATKQDDIDTIVFDELDTGISGDASISTAKKLAKISKYHQVVAISHLFQICSMADRNILVKKIEENGKTLSNVKILKEEETVMELCRFLSVNGVTESTLKHAQEVKKYCDDYKKSI